MSSGCVVLLGGYQPKILYWNLQISSRNGYFLNLLQSLHHVDTFGSETLRRDEVHGGRGGQVGRRRAQEVQRRRRDKDHGTAGLSSF